MTMDIATLGRAAALATVTDTDTIPAVIAIHPDATLRRTTAATRRRATARSPAATPPRVSTPSAHTSRWSALLAMTPAEGQRLQG